MAGTATAPAVSHNTEAGDTGSTTTLHLDETPVDRTSRANRARPIQKVYEVDPLESHIYRPALPEMPSPRVDPTLEIQHIATNIPTRRGLIFLSLIP